MKRYKKITVLLFLAVGCGLAATAQEAWDVDRCMSYAVKHNRTVKQRRLEADNYRLDRLKAIGSFLPGISASAGVQYNFGRSVDPETNIYNNVSTFNNSYAAEASMTLFRGGSLVNEVRRSKAALLLGKAALQEAQDNTALEPFRLTLTHFITTEPSAWRKRNWQRATLYFTKRADRKN